MSAVETLLNAWIFTALDRHPQIEVRPAVVFLTHLGHLHRVAQGQAPAADEG